MLVPPASECPCCASEVGTSGPAGGDEAIYNAEAADKARAAFTAFERDYGAKFPKAAAKIVDDADVLLEFYLSRVASR